MSAASVKRRAWSMVVGVLGLLVAAASPLRANPADLIGAGARNSGMANAGVSSTRDASASYYNPSALAWLTGAHLDLGYALSQPTLSINDTPVGPGLLQAPYVAFAAPGKLLGYNVAGGIIVMAPNQKEPLLRASAPEFMRFESRPKRVLLGVSAAFAINDRLTVGASVQYLAGLSAEIELDGVLGYPAGEDSQLFMKLDGSVKNARYPQVGVTWRPMDSLTIAALYRHKFQFFEEQSVSIHADIGLPNLPPVIDNAYLLVQSSAIKSFQPAVAWLSGSWQPNEQFELTADLGWFGWSKFVNPQASIHIESDFGDFSVPILPSEDRPQPGFADSYAMRVGTEFLPYGPTSRFAFRAGYGYQSAADGPQHDANNFIDGDLHTVAGGAGVRSEGFGVLPHPLYFDLFVQWSMQPSRLHIKDSPADLWGDYRAKGEQLSFGATVRLEF